MKASTTKKVAGIALLLMLVASVAVPFISAFECSDLDFNCDGEVNDEDKEIIADIYLEILVDNSVFTQDYIESFDCSILRDYLDSVFEDDSLFTFPEWNELAEAFDSLEGCEIEEDEDRDDDGDGGNWRDRFIHICEENWVYSDWSECSDGVQSRVGVDSNSCNVYVGEQVEIRGCLMDSVEAEFVEDEKGFPWLIVLLVGIAVLIVLIIIVLLM